MATEKFIVDLDTGLDDAKALLLLLSHPKVNLLAVTCVGGNTNLSNVCVNTLRVLKAAGRLGKVPVYAGCCKALVPCPANAQSYHGLDGLGDSPEEGMPTMDMMASGHASTHLVQLVNEHPGEITLLTLGPLTNVALAYRLDDSFSSKLKKIVTMGGTIEGRGNISPAAEFNFFVDPEAASIVVQEAQCPLTLLSWEASCKRGPSWEWLDRWISEGDTSKRNFLRKVYSPKTITRDKGLLKYFTPCDAIAAAIALHPEMATTELHHYAVEVGLSPLTRGMGVIDENLKVGKERKTHVCVEWDVEKFCELMEMI